MVHKEVRMLTFWQYGIKSVEFDELIRKLNVRYCGYFYEEEDEVRGEAEFEPIYLYNGLDFFSITEFQYELDEEIVREMSPYELMAMDIINRWRRSYSNKESYADIRRIYFIFLKYWYNFLRTREINFLVVNTMPHVPVTYIPYALCRILNIPVILQGIIPFTAGERVNYLLKPSIEEMDWHFEERLKNMKKIYEKKEFEDISLIPALSIYFDQYTSKEFNKKRVIYYNQKNTISDILKSYTDRMKLYVRRGEMSVLLNKMYYMAKIRLQSKPFLRKVEKFEQQPDLEMKYYFFPLHLQPEATTLPNGGVFADQLLAIRMLSVNMPKDTLLYVKEHPSYWMMKGRLEGIKESRSLAFYQEIVAMKNVRFIKHEYNSMELIEHCQGLVTVTGTAGFEALFKEIPVLLFGSAFYEKFDSVYRIRTNAECRAALDEIPKRNIHYDQRKVAIYLKALEKYVVPLGMREKNFKDNGTPGVEEIDRKNITNKIIEFYEEFYAEE